MKAKRDCNGQPHDARLDWSHQGHDLAIEVPKPGHHYYVISCGSNFKKEFMAWNYLLAVKVEEIGILNPGARSTVDIDACFVFATIEGSNVVTFIMRIVHRIQRASRGGDSGATCRYCERTCRPIDVWCCLCWSDNRILYACRRIGVVQSECSRRRTN